MNLSHRLHVETLDGRLEVLRPGTAIEDVGTPDSNGVSRILADRPPRESFYAMGDEVAQATDYPTIWHVLVALAG